MTLKRVLSRRGSAAMLFVFFFPIFLCALSMAWDLGRLYAAKVACRHALNLAVRAAAAEIDPDALADPSGPRLVVVPGRARASFDAILRANYTPLRGHLVDGDYREVFFYVVNYPDDAKRVGSLSTPFSYSTGDRTVTVAQPGVAAEIAVPVELGPFGKLAAGQNVVEMKVHTAAAPELRR
ncbi:TadE/TadG family type IV pilus assembly protein [Neomoorella thermoacetica]|uniref:TadE/TadG family type IV pilus assembly protein n=1 Tax=Neomoorella thermoacetica TaxID=1525 RepID=UPI0030CB6F31